jgi:hypothetical protein
MMSIESGRTNNQAVSGAIYDFNLKKAVIAGA